MNQQKSEDRKRVVTKPESIAKTVTSKDRERVTKLGSIKSRLGTFAREPEEVAFAQTVHEPVKTGRIVKRSSVKSRLGKKIEPESDEEMFEETEGSEDDEMEDEEAMMNSLKSKIIAIKKPAHPHCHTKASKAFAICSEKGNSVSTIESSCGGK